MPRNYRRGNLPYRSRRRYRKRMYGVKPKQRVNNWIDTAGSVVKLARDVYKIKQLVNSELKFHDTNSQTGISETGVISPLTAIAYGDDYNQRNGRSVLGKGLQMRYNLIQNDVATRTAVRVIIVADKENTGSNPPVTQILEAASIDSPWNKQNLIDKRFTYLYDKTFNLSDTGVQSIMRQEYISFRKHIMYTGTASGNYGSNNLFMLTISNESTNIPQIDYYSRFSYYDN